MSYYYDATSCVLISVAYETTAVNDFVEEYLSGITDSRLLVLSEI